MSRWRQIPRLCAHHVASSSAATSSSGSTNATSITIEVLGGKCSPGATTLGTNVMAEATKSAPARPGRQNPSAPATATTKLASRSGTRPTTVGCVYVPKAVIREHQRVTERPELPDDLAKPDDICKVRRAAPAVGLTGGSSARGRPTRIAESQNVRALARVGVVAIGELWRRQSAVLPAQTVIPIGVLKLPGQKPRKLSHNGSVQNSGTLLRNPLANQPTS